MTILVLGYAFVLVMMMKKLYSYEDLDTFRDKIRMITRVIQKDTTIKENFMKIRSDLERYVWAEIESYSNYEVTITDRYHGTIFFLFVQVHLLLF